MLSADATEILNNLARLLENENIRVALTQNGRACLIGTLCTVAGGLFGGQLGVTLGGLASAVLNGGQTSQFASLSQIIQNGLNEEQQANLAALLQGIIGATGISSNHQSKMAVIATALSFVQQLGLARKCLPLRSKY